MNANELSKRLQKVSQFVEENSRLADIGSDHAYLPVALMLDGKISYAIAGEVVEGPFQSAVKQVEKNGLTDKIDVRLGDGLSVIELADQIDTITICGVGGTLIKEILERGKTDHLKGDEQLILQPNIGERALRVWLVENGYTIQDEAIVEEKRQVYEIISAKKAAEKASYTTKELLFGPKILQDRNEAFKKKWTRELKQRQTVLESLNNAANFMPERIQNIETEIQMIKEVLA